MKTIKNWLVQTPMYHIKGTHIHVKLEMFQPSGSVKDRTVYGMLLGAMDTGKIHDDTKLIEATSGNTGISLAMFGAIYHIPVTIVMSDAMSEERRQLIQSYGANLLLSEGKDGMAGSLALMRQVMEQDSTYLTLNQFENEANPEIHEQTTGQEIIKQMGKIDQFVCCAGTGGTFTGVARALKRLDPRIRCVIGEPLHSAVISGHQAGHHAIAGIGANVIPKILDQRLIDDILWIDDAEAFAEMKQFKADSGISVGISSGANIALAKRLAHYYPDQTIVTIAPDGGDRYESVLAFS